MRKKFLSIFICILLLTQIFNLDISYAMDNSTNTTNSNIIDFKSLGLDTLGQFSELSMKLQLQNNGDAKIKYNITLSNDYLNSYRNSITEQLHNGTLKPDNFPNDEDYTSSDLYDNAVKQFNDSYYPTLDDEVLPTIKTELKYDKEYFDIPAGKEHIALYTNTTGEKIGSCDFTKSSDGDIILTCKFSKLVYNRTDVDLAFSLDYVLKKTLKSNETLIPVWDETTNIVTAKVVEKEEGLIEVEPEYSLKKTAPASVETPYIDYSIEVQAQDGYLNGQSVVDIIPDGLFVQSATVDGKTLESTNYRIEGTQFNYTFPSLSKDKSNALTKSKLSLRLYLTEDSYKKFMQDNQINKKFTNTAYLKDSVTGEQLTQPSSVLTQMKLSFLQKEGKQVDLYGTRFNWTVKVNSYFNHKVNAYIVDTINASAHTYDATNGVDILEDGTLKETVSPVSITSSVPYESLTIEDLDKLTADPSNSSKKRSVYYTYDELDGTKRSVLIIPYNKYVNDAVSINYCTDIVLPTGVKKEDYKEISDTLHTNKVKLVWDLIDFMGPGIPFEFNVEVEKDIQSKAFLVDKKYDSYNSATHEITWNLSVNKLGGEFENVYITDSVNKTMQTFPANILDGTGTIVASHIKNGATENVTIPSEANKVSGRPYYVISNTSDENIKTIKIIIGHLDSDESYVIPIKTLITYHNFYLNSTSVTFSNTATSYAENKGTPCGNESTDSKLIGNNLINKLGITQPFKTLSDKTSYTSYNYKEHTTKWRTIINEDKVDLEEVRAEEKLPVGSSFDKMTSFNIYKEDGSVLYTISSEDGKNFNINGVSTPAVESDDGLSLTISDQQVITWKETPGTTKPDGKDVIVQSNIVNVTFKNPINYKIDYEFYVKYSEEYRREIRANRSDLTISEVFLHAKYKGDDLQTVRKSNALTISPIVLSKKGHFNEDLGTITWTLYVNQDGVNLEGYSLVDLLKDQFDLELDTFTISKFDVTPLGENTNFVDITSDLVDSITLNNTQGFVFTIPSAYKTTPLCISFDTAITDNILKADASNQASLNNGKVQYRRTNEVIPDNMVDFNLYEFINASKLSSLFVNKVSSNKDASGQYKFLLSGSEFKLTAMKSTGTTWIEDAARYSKLRTSKSNGRAVFLNLERGIVYKLEEINASSGYEKSNTVDYFVFLKDNDSLNTYPQGTITIDLATKIWDTNFENTPTGNLSFKKVGYQNAPLPNAGFKLTRLDNKIAPRTSVSGSDGMVNFNALESGTYILSEVNVPEGYEAIDDLTVTIELNEDGTYSTSFKSNSSVSIDGDGNITIQDDCIVTPTITPTITPTATPTVTTSPSSASPTLPTIVPSSLPAATSSTTQGDESTVLSSAKPSVTPTSTPTVSPSIKPSAKPSTTPSTSTNGEQEKHPNNTNETANKSTNNNSNSNPTPNTSNNKKPNSNNSYNTETAKNNRDQNQSSTNSVQLNETSESATSNQGTIPKTGDNSLPLATYFILGLLSLTGIIFSTKKLLQK